MSIRAEDVPGLNLSDIACAERIGSVVPGEVLREEFMAPLGLSGRALARELGVPSNRITEIVAGERAITAETAILLAERFGTTAEFWLNLQTAHDLEIGASTLTIQPTGRRAQEAGLSDPPYRTGKIPRVNVRPPHSGNDNISEAESRVPTVRFKRRKRRTA